MEAREETPPHHPTHGVHLSDHEIGAILRVCLPEDPAAYTYARLPHGKSFNNRIYMIDNTLGLHNSYILKVNGKFFGPAKIENEVACLQILQRYCPAVPVPRVVAWSIEGCQVILADSGKQDLDPKKATVNVDCRCGWILMTRLPGEPIDPSTLAAEHVPSLSLQLAKIISCWRHAVPRSDRCGNLRLRTRGVKSQTPSWQSEEAKYDLGFDIQGILEIGLDETYQPMTSLLSYWSAKLSHAIKQLSTKEIYAGSRQLLLPPLNRFIEEILPNLAIFQNSPEEKNGFVFTHTDLSSRNVLVAGSPPRITGVVDFEFSGFFPEMHDFTGYSIVSDEDDEGGWPVLMYNEVLRHLEDTGVVTPLYLKGSRQWRDLMGLVDLETYIAPWWLATGGTEADELARELEVARGKIEDALLALKGEG